MPTDPRSAACPFPPTTRPSRAFPAPASTPSGRTSTTPAAPSSTSGPIAAYNGWRLGAETRGGHIPGARAFPIAWLDASRVGRDRRACSPRRARRRAGRSSSTGMGAATPTGWPPGSIDAGLDAASVLEGGFAAWAADDGQPGRQAPPPRAARPRGLAERRCSPGGRSRPAERRRAAVPRQLRGPRGVRGRPHPGRPLPRHELARVAGRLEPAVTRRARPRPARARDHRRHDGHRLRPGHRGRRQREVARPPGRPDRRDARRPDPALRGRPRRPPPRRRLRLVGPRRPPARDDAAAARARCPSSGRRSRRTRSSSSTCRRRRRSSPTGRRGARQRPHVEGAHRQGQRLQLHPAGRPDPGRRVGQLRHRRVPHAALPERGQHDAGVPRDRRQLGRGRDHARQVGRVLLRHRLARERDLVLRRPAGLGADRGLRRRLARVELGPGQQPDRRRRPAEAGEIAA